MDRATPPLAALFLALLLPGCAGIGAAAVRDDAALVAQLTAQADRWDRAIVRKDRAAIEANMAEDFRQIDGAAGVETGRSFVDGLMDPALRIDPYQVEELEVRLYGDVALLSGRTRMTGSYQGKPFESHYRYIDVYVRRGGAWKIVSVQITRVPEPRPG
ncbi:MAG: nuclear transport factor 2 family protein [Deltaproteobacteria bacterium]|nr:nuclear transport factor 2 family protein [Deltaproteobacteria bacterium]